MPASATGWSEPVCGRESRPLESSGFLGALFRQPHAALFSIGQKIGHCGPKVVFELLPFPARCVFGLLGKGNDGLQLGRSLMPVANVYSDVRGLVKHVRLTGYCPSCSFGRKGEACLVFWKGSVYSHLSKGRVNLFWANIAGDRIYQPCQSSQETAIKPVL
jgi:hypothetical protein